MNLYFVFEGKTEPIVYKKWLSVLLPDLTEVNSFDAVIQNNYYYESDMGVPNLSYKKYRPKEVQEEYYLKQLRARIETNSDHLLSFQEFINFCLKINRQQNK
ncbi:hypothetical protein PCC9214_05756 [Planktothrix tepida]|uniref:Uncharacterized protein n=1 Tax=Planktothrix tepida PCC 9214 TaxID=671072 RepID=A0A1J1LUW6_9CYAN|nr:hypothetical protein [Planktothrix tepida]CAD5990273.1 hypothetical protein PCC9214_05756 [Planktothrix tepida]CUR35652.1 conserved hypothetical protein [Planktothrix tepida PCC 9214]